MEKISLPEQNENALEIREALRIVFKHKMKIIYISATFFLIIMLYALVVPCKWEGVATVKLPDATTEVAAQSLKELMSFNSSADPIETYIEVSKSKNVAMRAINATDLMRKEKFAKDKSISDVAQLLIEKKIVTITNVKDSDILEIHIKLNDPVLAVELANAWADSFIQVYLDFSHAGAKSRKSFIESQMAEIRDSLNKGEEALKQLSQKQGVIHSITNDKGGVDPVAVLETKIEDLLMQKSQLGSQFNSNFPALKALNAEYDEAIKELNKIPANEMEYIRLARDVKAFETIYNFLLEKDQEERINENSDDSGIVIVDRALPLDTPIWPKIWLLFLIAVIGGPIIGIIAAYILEQWLDEVGGEAELQQLLNLPILALIPNWRQEIFENSDEIGKKQIKIAEDSFGLGFRSELQHTYFNESFRSLRTNLLFSGVDKKIRTFCILSANQSEGKTLANANLALALAATGSSVLLVDADLRKPNIHKMFSLDVDRDKGLPRYLADFEVGNLEKHLFKGPVDNLYVMPCGVIPPNPSELISSEAMSKAIKIMKDKFDYVIFDGAPILPVTDSVELSMRIDGVAILACFEETRRVEIKRAYDTLKAVNATVAGAILNKVEMKRYSYSYGYGARYYSYHEK
jgi:tyrosine-protein kinase Etk/Wzc